MSQIQIPDITRKRKDRKRREQAIEQQLDTIIKMQEMTEETKWYEYGTRRRLRKDIEEARSRVITWREILKETK